MWLRSDDGHADEPQLRRAGWAATGLHYWAMSYAAKHGTDGHVPREVVEGLKGGLALAAKLIAVGTWEIRADGFYIPAYLQMGNPTRAQLDEHRRREREKKRRQIASRRDSPGEPVGESPDDSPGERTGDSPLNPSRPVQSRMKKTEKNGQFAHVQSPFIEKYTDRLMTLLGEQESHRRPYWLKEFSEAPEAVVVAALEEFQLSVRNGGVKNRGAYFQQLWARLRHRISAQKRTNGDPEELVHAAG